jgi:glycerol-3-phosphate dehydrogenase
LALVEAAQEDELTPISGTPYLWAELRWAARAEGVVHLDDLLLRRVRLGLLLKDGGAKLMGRIQAICQAELGWDDGRWQTEAAAYLALRRRYYGLPKGVPDWRLALAKKERERETAVANHRTPSPKRTAVALLLLAFTLLFLWLTKKTRPRR